MPIQTLEILTKRYDNSSETINVLCKIDTKEFLEIVECRKLLDKSHKFEEQRDFLKGQKAKIIQQRLEKDIIKGTQLPPISFGIVDENSSYGTIDEITKEFLDTNYLSNKDFFLTIIDGIQRSTMLKKVYKENNIEIDNILLLDILISKERFNLLNRMFVLNFGQTPWGEEQQASIIWNILDLKSEIDEKFKASHLLTFLYAYIYNKFDKIIEDEMDYFYTNLSLLEHPIDKNITGELFDDIYKISEELGKIFRKNTILVKTTCYAAFANITEWNSNTNEQLVYRMSIIREILSELIIDNSDGKNEGIEYLNTCYGSFKSAVGAKQRKFFYALLTELFDHIIQGVNSITIEDFKEICDNAKSEANKKRDED